ncbi:hypothetical protein BS78_03G005000 [Paspalum vaginatum]|nr:hypothetical protein BS78_03G005000 [Paspalum vaginatum]
MEAPMSDFIFSITGSENFLTELPSHLKRQLKIRKIVQAARRPPPLPPLPAPLHVRLCRCMGNAVCAPCKLCAAVVCASRPPSEVDYDSDSAAATKTAAATDDKDPMDKLVDFLRSLPQMYRLNVLDLGGCMGIRQRHLKCLREKECRWLKYLSLRNTDVSRLHAHRHINKLKMLETLDIRGTNIPASDTRAIDLPKLKHLLAGRYDRPRGSQAPSSTPPVHKEELFTVDMPRRIGSMRRMETLSHVQVSWRGAELEGVVRLHHLRKLGVVVHGNNKTAVYLERVLHVLAPCLRSLSIWVAVQTQEADGGGLDISFSMAAESSTMVLENLDIKGKISSLPPWISKAQKLANVTLRDTEISGVEALWRLGSVISLRCLKLSRQVFTEPALVFKDEGQFRALKFLVIEGCGAINSVAFAVADAAPVLEKIVWDIGGGISRSSGMVLRGGGGDSINLITGIHNLPRLKRIELRGDFNFTALSAWLDATTPLPKPRYRCCFRSSSDTSNAIDNKKPTSDTTLSLPFHVINVTR